MQINIFMFVSRSKQVVVTVKKKLYTGEPGLSAYFAISIPLLYFVGNFSDVVIVKISQNQVFVDFINLLSFYAYIIFKVTVANFIDSGESLAQLSYALFLDIGANTY